MLGIGAVVLIGALIFVYVHGRSAAVQTGGNIWSELIGPTWDTETWYTYVMRDVEYPNIPVSDFFRSLGVDGFNPRWTPILKGKDGQAEAIIMSIPKTKIDRMIQRHFLSGTIKRRYSDDNLRPGMTVYIIEIKRDIDGMPAVADPKVRIKGSLVRLAEFAAGRFHIVWPANEAQQIRDIRDLFD